MSKLKLEASIICPFSRQVRILLSELEKIFELKLLTDYSGEIITKEVTYERMLPILEYQEAGESLYGWYSILEFFYDSYKEHKLFLDFDSQRNIIGFVNNNFYFNCVKKLLQEKVQSYLHNQAPNSKHLRDVKIEISKYLAYFDERIEEYNWFGCESFQIADIAAAASISLIDYFGDVDWDDFENLQEWYRIVKSKPSMRKILQDEIKGFPPARHYKDPDF